MMPAQTFFLICNGNTNLAIQAGPTNGTIPTLQAFDPANPLQTWVMQGQVSGGWQGVALVNPATGNSATYQGEFENLIMQPYSPNSQDFDSFLLFNADDAGNLRIALAKNTGISWNDRGGQYQAGDPICLWDDTGEESVWTLQLANAPVAQVAVPAIAGQAVAAGS